MWLFQEFTSKFISNWVSIKKNLLFKKQYLFNTDTGEKSPSENLMWVEVGMMRRMSFNSHISELCKAFLNIPELHMPANSVTPQQLDPLGCSCFTDGWWENGLLRAGYMVYHHNTEWQSEVWLLNSYSTIFQPDLDAIGKLAIDLCKQKSPSTAIRKPSSCHWKTVLSTRSAVSGKHCNHLLSPRTH